MENHALTVQYETNETLDARDMSFRTISKDKTKRTDSKARHSKGPAAMELHLPLNLTCK